MEFTDLKIENLPNTLRLLEKALDKTQLANANDGAPSEAYIASLSKGTQHARAYSEKYGVRLDTLQYFVALEAGNVVGASGIYHINNQYIDPFWRETHKELALELVKRRNYFMGWTAVAKEKRKSGMGRQLLKQCLIRAQLHADANGISDLHWCVLADSKSKEFFEKKVGMTRIASYLKEELYRDPISNVLNNLDH